MQTISQNYEGCFFPGVHNSISQGAQSHRENRQTNKKAKSYLCIFLELKFHLPTWRKINEKQPSDFYIKTRVDILWNEVKISWIFKFAGTFKEIYPCFCFKLICVLPPQLNPTDVEPGISGQNVPGLPTPQEEPGENPLGQCFSTFLWIPGF